MLALNTGPSRLSLAAILAAPLVYGLFLAANALISVNDIQLDEKPQRLLTELTPQTKASEAPQERTRPVMVEATKKPPPLTRPVVRTGDFGPAGGVWTGETPAQFEIGEISFGVISASPMDARDLVAVREPVPSIPQSAISRGISGSCDVFFDVNTAGRPQNVFAKCTDNIFKAEAERAVRRAEFLPAIRNGQPVAQKNAIYPIEFKVN